MIRNLPTRGSTRLGTAALVTAVLAMSPSLHATITIPTVTIGNAGNAADTRVMNDGTTGYGSVSYAYNIGKYEVTASQYTAFLNAVAATDIYSLYNTSMASDEAGCQIIRSGTAGSYTYSVASDYANRPVNYVSFGDSARFSNWLANGQPTGTQSASTTESGSYTLSGAITNAALLAATRNTSATWFVTSENEWYKAAFYNPSTASYYEYATASNTLPSNTLVNPDPGNNANYRSLSDVDTVGSPYFRTEVGAFANSDSAYGTFDQNGNVWEWNESNYFGLFKEMRGGAIGTYDTTLSASFRYFDTADFESNAVGFRVASSVIIAPGDFNEDGVVNAVDIDLLFAAVQGAIPSATAKYDVTGDGIVNSAPNTSGSDADYWVRVLKSTEYGDINLDNSVTFDDLLVLAQNYGASAGTWAQGDMDGEDGIGFGDLLLLAQNYGFGTLTADQFTALGDLNTTFSADWAAARWLVPEPTSIAAIAFATTMFGRRTRRN